MRAPSRLDQSTIARWWWTVDHFALGLVAAIATVGFVVLMAAGPGASARLGIADSFHFPMRQLLFLGPAFVVLVAVSALSALNARRLAAIAFVVAMLLMTCVLLFESEINGAKRWLVIGSLGLLQPSEFAKSGFIVVAAWMLAEGARHPSFPGGWIASALFGAFLLLLVLQPDYGQAALVTAVWMTMVFVVGWHWLMMGAIGAAGLAALAFGYARSPHLARRLDAFLDPATAETYQIDKAAEAFAYGGLLGRGGEATVKLDLPDAHTDFIFAVAGEEGGFILSLIILALFAALVVRLLLKAAALKSVFAQCAVAGLAASIGLQSLINMGVALKALPAKGMTLPFISYGGSSLLATGLAFGLMLAFCRAQDAPRRRREILS
jgi:cell division protein FtsW